VLLTLLWQMMIMMITTSDGKGWEDTASRPTIGWTTESEASKKNAKSLIVRSAPALALDLSDLAVTTK
jgi:hypothetical protein